MRNFGVKAKHGRWRPRRTCLALLLLFKVCVCDYRCMMASSPALIDINCIRARGIQSAFAPSRLASSCRDKSESLNEATTSSYSNHETVLKALSQAFQCQEKSSFVCLGPSTYPSTYPSGGRQSQNPIDQNQASGDETCYGRLHTLGDQREDNPHTYHEKTDSWPNTCSKNPRLLLMGVPSITGAQQRGDYQQEERPEAKNTDYSGHSRWPKPYIERYLVATY